MLLNEFYTITNEVAKSYDERSAAAEKFIEIYKSWEDSWKKDDTPPTKEQIKALVDLSKICGRSYEPYWNRTTIGSLIDFITRVYRSHQISSGTMPAFSSTSVPTAEDMARRIAEQTNGSYTWKHGIVWTSSRGGRHRDPQDHIQYETRDDLDSAWEWCLQRGKQVHYYDSLRSLQTAIRIGRYIIERASTWSQRLGHNYLLSVRTVKALQNSLISVQKITDQQAAALRDLAQTRTANTIQKLQIIIDILQSKNTTDIKTAIDLTPLIDPRDKEKLDKIIDDAKNLPPEQLDEDLKKKLGTAAALAAGMGITGLGYNYYSNQPTYIPDREHQYEITKQSRQAQEIENKRSGMANSVAFVAKLKDIAAKLQVSPIDLIKVMYFETRGTLSAAITSPRTKATGLIQFMPITASRLGTSVDELRSMSELEQLDYVYKYFTQKSHTLPPGSSGSDIYLFLLVPEAIKRDLSDNHVLAINPETKDKNLKKLLRAPMVPKSTISKAKMWNYNSVFRQKGKDFYTVGDVRRVFDAKTLPAYIIDLYK